MPPAGREAVQVDAVLEEAEEERLFLFAGYVEDSMSEA